MSGVSVANALVKSSVMGAVMFGAASIAIANDNDGTPLTGKLMMEKLSNEEFTWFVTGMVEGLAYARFRKDTLAAGERAESGMKCIRTWFRDDPRIILRIEDAFRKYDSYAPWVVLGVMIKKECGE